MFGRIGGCFALIILLRQYNQSTMRRIGGDFPFCRVVVLEIFQYFCVLPPCKTKNLLFSAVKDFCSKRPMKGRGARGRRHTGVF
ncbi:MAG: hypothetical protein DBY09_03575 [Selenomonadales bacterium]|nr:MAG: hypothetical protein DBY09_03575 [Selenomonadales bacterium]